jgi:hypothetical protein
LGLNSNKNNTFGGAPPNPQPPEESAIRGERGLSEGSNTVPDLTAVTVDNTVNFQYWLNESKLIEPYPSKR